MELVKIAEYDEEKQRLAYSEAMKAAKKKGCRLLTVEEWIDSGIKYGHPLYCCSPSWLQKTKGGLLARGGIGGDLRWSVVAGVQPSVRFGVVGTPIKKTHLPAGKVHSSSCGKKPEED